MESKTNESLRRKESESRKKMFVEKPKNGVSFQSKMRTKKVMKLETSRTILRMKELMRESSVNVAESNL